MPAYRLFDKLQTFYGDAGQALPGGYLVFYTAGTTTPQSVYGDRALSTNNGNEIALTSSSRLAHECWADTTDAYFVEIYNAADVKQGEISYVEVPGGSGQAVPVPNEGEVISGDGTNFILISPNFVPDQTGNAGKILGTDGTLIQWVVKPEDGEAGTSDISVDANGYSVGDARVTWGSGTGSNVGGRSQSASVTFPVVFGATPDHVAVTVTNSGALSSFGNTPTVRVTSKSTTGCSIEFKLSELDDDRSGYDFNAAVAFSYVAFGEKA